MNARVITITIAVLLLAGVAYYIGTNRGSSDDADTVAGTTSQQVIPQQDPKLTETSAQLVGEWKSEDDGKYSREFRADGTVTDMYEGDASATASGTWKVFNASTRIPTGVTFSLDQDVTYIHVVMDGETYSYGIVKVTGEKLELIYMDRGGMLRFAKVDPSE